VKKEKGTIHTPARELLEGKSAQPIEPDGGKELSEKKDGFGEKAKGEQTLEEGRHQEGVLWWEFSCTRGTVYR